MEHSMSFEVDTICGNSDNRSMKRGASKGSAKPPSDRSMLVRKGVSWGLLTCTAVLLIAWLTVDLAGIKVYPAVIGFVGDALNLVGAVILAYELLFKDRDHIHKIVQHLLVERKVRVKLEDTVVSTQEEAEFVRARRTVRDAVWGCTVLLVGSSIILYGRFLEYYEQQGLHRLLEKDRQTDQFPKSQH
jgi:hypothetical protein